MIKLVMHSLTSLLFLRVCVVWFDLILFKHIQINIKSLRVLVWFDLKKKSFLGPTIFLQFKFA